MMETRRRFALLVTALAMTPMALAGCMADGPTKEHKGASRPAPPKLAITPANDAKNVPISAEIGTTVTDGKVASVKVTDDKGAPVDGAPRPDGTTWVPAKPLKNQQTYRAEVTARNDSGQTVTRNTTFTTMAKPSGRTITSVMYFRGNQTYGTAMPVTVAFDPGIPKEARADVQRRLFVSTDPPQPGAWHWLDDGTQVYYRAPDFWKPGTTITVRAALEGLPIGKDTFGDEDRTATSKIADHQVSLDIDNATKQISVYRDGQMIRKIPVSLGKSSTPSSSGKMVIMEKFDRTTFDTRGEPNGGYVVDVDDAQRLTWGGEFIHAAPWSVGDQGERNVSHGCANVSNEAADWLMKTTHVGDLVSVTGTEVQLQPGNGWTAWNQSWDEYVKGSALPVPPDLKPSASASPSPSGAGTGGPSGGPTGGGSPAAGQQNSGG